MICTLTMWTGGNSPTNFSVDSSLFFGVVETKDAWLFTKQLWIRFDINHMSDTCCASNAYVRTSANMRTSAESAVLQCSPEHVLIHIAIRTWPHASQSTTKCGLGACISMPFQCVLDAFTPVSSAVHLWLDHSGCMLIPGVNKAIDLKDLVSSTEGDTWSQQGALCSHLTSRHKPAH